MMTTPNSKWLPFASEPPKLEIHNILTKDQMEQLQNYKAYGTMFQIHNKIHKNLLSKEYLFLDMFYEDYL